MSLPFDGEPADTRAAIMHATYRALCEHGYADLTIQRIGDEFPKSKSLLYHHYDGKDDLLVDFLEFLLEHFRTETPSDDYADPHAHLLGILDHVLPDSLDDERHDFLSAMTELRAQSPHDEAYRDHFTRADEYVEDRIADVVRRGIDQGQFRDVDAERTARFLSAAITGARVHQVTANEADALTATRRELENYVETHLRTERPA